jgi:four helix bundle protein
MMTAISDQRSAIRASAPPGRVAKSYRELQVWQRSIQLSVALYRLTDSFPRQEIYGLTNQLRRAGISVAINIAEGYGRASKGEYRNFIGMARGSALEIQTQLVIARELGFGDPRVISGAEQLAEETGKMLWAMMQKL